MPSPADSHAETVDVTIERILPGGLGFAHAGDRTVLVPLTAADDRVRVRIDRRQGRVSFGTVIEVLEASPDRVDPPCPYFGACGGCDFQHLRYEAQLGAKAGIVRDCLRRIAGIDPAPEITVQASPDPWRYRGRAEWQLDRDAGALGYFAAESHRVVDVAECLVLSPELERVFSALRGRLAARRLPAGVRSFDAGAGDGQASLAPPVGELRSGQIGVEVGPYRYRFDASVFFQANLGLLPALVDEALWFPRTTADPGAVDLDEEGNPRRTVAVDLYCGVGLFTVPLAAAFDRVFGVEVHAKAATIAHQNLRDAGFEHVRVASMPVDRWLGTRARSLHGVDLVVLDPPRSGVDPTALAGLIALRPARISYVSCDPATLARDLKRLLGAGYDLRRVAALDMFPQTHHVEVVAHLERGATLGHS